MPNIFLKRHFSRLLLFAGKMRLFTVVTITANVTSQTSNERFKIAVQFLSRN